MSEQIYSPLCAFITPSTVSVLFSCVEWKGKKKNNRILLLPHSGVETNNEHPKSPLWDYNCSELSLHYGSTARDGRWRFCCHHHILSLDFFLHAPHSHDVTMKRRCPGLITLTRRQAAACSFVPRWRHEKRSDISLLKQVVVVSQLRMDNVRGRAVTGFDRTWLINMNRFLRERLETPIK